MARKQNLVKKVAIIDLDVHHGDGNATLLADHPDCFILNMFGEKNYPSKNQIQTWTCPSKTISTMISSCIF